VRGASLENVVAEAKLGGSLFASWFVMRGGARIWLGDDSAARSRELSARRPLSRMSLPCGRQSRPR